MSVRQMPLRRRLRAVAMTGLLCVPTAQAVVQARLSQNPVYVGDTLMLTLSSDTGGNGAQPDLSPLERDFDVLGTGTRTQLNVVNGRRSALTQWRVELLPRHSGNLTIPALQLGAQHSQPLAVKVTASPPPAQAAAMAATAKHLFVETRVDPAAATPYVQQQIPYTVRLYYDDSLLGGTLAEPQVADAVVERVGEDTRFNTTRNGRQYQVIERRYAIFPQKSGELQIPVVRFDGRITDSGNGRSAQPHAGSLVQRFLQNSPFANDPFFQGGGFGSDVFGGLFGDPGQAVHAFGPALDVMVRPRAVTQGAWLPAREVKVHDSWTDAPPQLRVGEPVSRTITVEADGLTGSQIPPLDLPAPATLRVYREPAENATHNDGDQLVGISRQTLRYIPDTAGALDVPPVTLAWWNTRKDAAATAGLPAWYLTVGAGNGGQPPAVAPPAVTGSAATPLQLASSTPALSRTWRDALSAHWREVVAATALLPAAALAGLWLRGRRRSPPRAIVNAAHVPARTVPRAPSAEPAALLKNLEAACRTHDAASAARALLALAAVRWPLHPPCNLADLASRLTVGGEAVCALERYLYGVGHGEWPADELWNAVRKGLQAESATTATEVAGDLPPLYPHHA